MPTREQPSALAGERREALRRRARRIRRTVAAFAASLFSAAFLVVYVQLASGHDPALVANAKRAAVTRTSAEKASSGSSSSGKATSSGSTSSSGEASSGESSSSQEGTSSASTSSSEAEASSGVAAVTTSQS